MKANETYLHISPEAQAGFTVAREQHCLDGGWDNLFTDAATIFLGGVLTRAGHPKRLSEILELPFNVAQTCQVRDGKICVLDTIPQSFAGSSEFTRHLEPTNLSLAIAGHAAALKTGEVYRTDYPTWDQIHLFSAGTYLSATIECSFEPPAYRESIACLAEYAGSEEPSEQVQSLGIFSFEPLEAIVNQVIAEARRNNQPRLRLVKDGNGE